MMHASSVAGHGGRAADLDPIKAKIVSHPSYHRLLAAFLDCHKARAPIDDPSTLARARAHVFVPVAAILPRLHVFIYSCRICAHLTQVGCPPEAAEEIAAVAREREAWQRAAAGDVAHTRPDPELDQFMVEYRTKHMHACT